MKAPFWAVCCACVLQLTGNIYAADETDRSQTVGPTAAPLGRPVSEADYFAAQAASSRAPANFSGDNGAPANTLRYPTIVAMPPSSSVGGAPAAQSGAAWNAAAPTAGAPTVATASPAPLGSTAGAVPTAEEKKSDGAKSGGVASKVFSNPFKNAQLSGKAKPEAKAPAVVAAPVTPAPTQGEVSDVSPWRPMQTAYRQLSNPPAVANSQPPINPVIAPNNPPSYSPPGRIPSQYGPADPPTPTPAPFTGGAVDLSKPTPIDPPYANGETARLKRIAAYEAVYGPTGGGPGGVGGGDCGCNGGKGGLGCYTCGSPGDSQICPNCGGWDHGTCLTNNPNGSCVCERFICCITKPYPDCSNGCVDFCHSWIFHEDDCWLTSNKKCPGPGCGPYPYGSCPADGMGKGNGCGCGNCGPCIRPNPVYFSAEGLVLLRDNQASDQDIAFDGTDPILSVGDFSNFDWKAGPSFTLGYKPTPMDAWEISYFGLQDWNETQTLARDGNVISLPPELGETLGFANVDTLSVTYSSTIHNAEVNYFWHPRTKWWNWMAGFRYFQLNEQFNFATTVVADDLLSEYNTQTVNNLYGGQLGCRAQFCGERWGFNATGKAGAFGNVVEVTQQIGLDTLPLERDSRTTASNWAFVGQVGASVSYNFTRHWYVMGGYDALWLNGLALAPDQLDFTVLPESGTNINHNGSLFLHGVHGGVGVQW